MFQNRIMITDMVPVDVLDEVSIEDMEKFANEQGFWVVKNPYELTIGKDGEEVFHQKFFGRQYVAVIDYLTAMSKATGMYRIEILLRLKEYRKLKHL